MGMSVGLPKKRLDQFLVRRPIFCHLQIPWFGLIQQPADTYQTTWPESSPGRTALAAVAICLHRVDRPMGFTNPSTIPRERVFILETTLFGHLLVAGEPSRTSSLIHRLCNLFDSNG